MFNPILFCSALALAVIVTPALAAHKGFNYGDKFADGKTVKVKNDYVQEFTAALNLADAQGFTSARLFSMLQNNTDEPIEAIEAAIETDTRLLLGLWASSDTPQNRDALISRQPAALKTAITAHGKTLTDLINGISVGSEDMYCITDLGIKSSAGPGTSATDLVPYIQQVREALAGGPGANVLVGHVDTYGCWADKDAQGVAALINTVDFLGVDAYPYYQNNTSVNNSISSANATPWDDFNEVVAVANGKKVWITETGWPHKGPNYGPAVASTENAQEYWKTVGCSLWSANIDTWWYILQDEQPGSEMPIAFGILPASTPGQKLSQAASFDVKCGS